MLHVLSTETIHYGVAGRNRGAGTVLSMAKGNAGDSSLDVFYSTNIILNFSKFIFGWTFPKSIQSLQKFRLFLFSMVEL